MDILALVITHPSCMAECPELNKFQYNYLLYSSETEATHCYTPAFATSFYSSQVCLCSIVFSDTLQPHVENKIFILTLNKYSAWLSLKHHTVSTMLNIFVFPISNLVISFLLVTNPGSCHYCVT